MGINIFLSYPKTHTKSQSQFIDFLTTYLSDRGISPRTLGVTEYDTDNSLTAIRRLMLESNGLITIAFRRLWIKSGVVKRGADLPHIAETEMTDQWLTSPYCQIEPAMSYQLGLPILIFKEQGVISEGILEKGALGTYMPEFDLTHNPTSYLGSQEFKAVIGKWEGHVRAVVNAKGNPPKIY